MTSLPRNERRRDAGFTLLELMVALVVTLVITGSMWGLMASGQSSFRREPALMDRQQNIRLAMTRIQEDVYRAGLGLGNLVQSFAENQNAVGVAGAAGNALTGVRPAADVATLGGGLPDLLEIRAQTDDCPAVRVTQVGNSIVFNVVGGVIPDCYTPPIFVLALFPSGAAKWAMLTQTPGGDKFQFAVGLNNAVQGSQFTSVANASCDLYLPGNDKCPGDPGGPPAPPPPAIPNNQPPHSFVRMDRIIYRLGLDVDGTPTLFRSQSGGFDSTTQTFGTLPPGPAWQAVARGVEDMQIRYRTFAGWQDNAPPIVPPSFDNVVREVEVTLWARTVGENQLQGQTLAAGNQVTAIRGSLVTSISPRAAQIALMSEPLPAKRWQ